MPGRVASIWVSGNNGYAAPNAAPPPGKSDDMLLKFTPEGKFLLQIGHSGKSTGDADHDNVKQAADMMVFKNELYVADGYGNHRVVVFDAKTGAFKRTWTANGGTPFNIVHAIRVSNDGLVYVADRENKRVQVFTTGGDFKQQVIIGGEGVTRSAAGLAFSPDRAQQYLYVADINNAMHILDRQLAEGARLVRQGRNGAGRVRHRSRDRDGLEGESLHGGAADAPSAEVRREVVQTFRSA